MDCPYLKHYVEIQEKDSTTIKQEFIKDYQQFVKKWNLTITSDQLVGSTDFEFSKNGVNYILVGDETK